MNPYYEKNDILIYHNDNLDVLAQLEKESIQLIYCDILYNTGKVFDDYSDNLGDPKEAIEWYRPRMEEMKRVLKKDGSIFIHCNWRLDSYIRILMDEVFGVPNFRNRIYRKHSKERGFYANFDSQVDSILYYVKDTNQFIFKELVDETERVIPLFENGYVVDRSRSIDIQDRKIEFLSKNKHSLVSKQQLMDLDEKGELIFIDKLPYRKTKAKPIGNLWDEDSMLDDYSRNKIADAYDTPKPDAVLERIIKMCSNEGDTIGDFFMGGGTTAVITRRLNRKGIFCDISQKACDIAVSKLQKENKI